MFAARFACVGQLESHGAQLVRSTPQYGVLRCALPLRVTAPLSVALWRYRVEGRSGKISTACGASNKGHDLV
jgi:hypothetical protein